MAKRELLRLWIEIILTKEEGLQERRHVPQYKDEGIPEELKEPGTVWINETTHAKIVEFLLGLRHDNLGTFHKNFIFDWDGENLIDNRTQFQGIYDTFVGANTHPEWMYRKYDAKQNKMVHANTSDLVKGKYED